MRAPSPLQAALPQVGDFASSLIAGLSRTPREIACKFFYDAEGSRLFDAICAQPEYYQTRTELALLAAHAGEIATLIGAHAEMVEFGAGAVTKARILLDALEQPVTYSPMDISGDYLAAATHTLAADYPGLKLRPLVADFTMPLHLPPLADAARRVGFFPGGTIGNFRPDTAVLLLQRMRAALNGGGLLVGVDLVKDPRRLHAAYNDAGGATEAFNKNMLVRANRELGANFDLNGFAHYAPYNCAARRVEMYLVSLKRQDVRIGAHCFSFAAGEAIHTEDSHKYTIEAFREMAARAGFRPRAVWTDAERLFALHWLEG